MCLTFSKLFWWKVVKGGSLGILQEGISGMKHRKRESLFRQLMWEVLD